MMNSISTLEAEKLKEPVCMHFGICGGCDYQNIDYKQQLKLKDGFVEEMFKDFNIGCIEKIVPSPKVWYYRNKMEFACSGEVSEPKIGLRQKNKFDNVVDLRECRIFHQEIANIFEVVKNWIKETYFEPYNLRTHKGRLRYLSFKYSKTQDKLLLNIVITGTKYQYEYSDRKNIELLVNNLSKLESLMSIYLCINNKVSDNALTEDIFLIYGQKFLKEKIKNKVFRITPLNFLQVNTSVCEILYDTIKANIDDGNVIDVYCGSGGISIYVADKAEKVIGVDSSSSNIQDAIENANENDVKNIEFVSDNAEIFLSKLSKSKFMTNLSTIIVDPPRSGLSKKVISNIIESAVNKIIYVSCNCETLREDLKLFSRFYKIKKITPFDMFPHTKHLELLAILEHI